MNIRMFYNVTAGHMFQLTAKGSLQHASYVCALYWNPKRSRLHFEVVACWSFMASGLKGI